MIQITYIVRLIEAIVEVYSNYDCLEMLPVAFVEIINPLSCCVHVVLFSIHLTGSLCVKHSISPVFLVLNFPCESFILTHLTQIHLWAPLGCGTWFIKQLIITWLGLGEQFKCALIHLSHMAV